MTERKTITHTVPAELVHGGIGAIPQGTPVDVRRYSFRNGEGWAHLTDGREFPDVFLIPVRDLQGEKIQGALIAAGFTVAETERGGGGFAYHLKGKAGLAEVTDRTGLKLPTDDDWAAVVWDDRYSDEADTDIQCDDDDPKVDGSEAVSIIVARLAELEAGK